MKTILGKTLILLVLVLTLLAAFAAVATADTAVPCSGSALVSAITAANTASGDTLNLAASCTYTLTASATFEDYGPNGLPSVTSTIVINGNGSTIQRGSASNFRIIHVAASGDLTLNDLTITGGHSGVHGGGIYNRGRLQLNDCVVTGNGTGNGTISISGGGSGGGIYSIGTLGLTNSVVSNNTTGYGANLTTQQTYVGLGGPGGGIYSSGAATLVNSTVTGNVTGRGGSNTWCDHYTVDGGLGGHGAGIYNTNTGTLALTYSTVSGNTAGSGGSGFNGGPGGDGGGIYSQGQVSLKNSTISGNTSGTGGNAGCLGWGSAEGGSGGSGGAIFTSGSLVLARSTLSHNIAAAGGTGNVSGPNGQGGGIYVAGSGASASLSGSIVGNSTRGDCVNDAGTVTNAGYNLIEAGGCGFTAGGDPGLLPLQNSGGLTETHIPGGSSPAIDRGNPTYSPEPGETDQRGLPRIINGRIDIGSVETNPVCWATFDDGASVYGSEDAGAVQAAVDAAAAGNTIKVAGTCTGVQAAHSSTQTLYVSRNVTVEGGYAVGNWTIPDPTGQRTVLDANSSGRVVHIPSTVSTTLRYLTITGGNTGSGAGVYNAGTVVLDKSTVYNNNAPGASSNVNLRGGGLYNIGTMLVGRLVRLQPFLEYTGVLPHGSLGASA